MELRRNQGSAGPRASSPVRENRVYDSLMQRRGGAASSTGQQDWQPQMEQVIDYQLLHFINHLLHLWNESPAPFVTANLVV